MADSDPISDATPHKRRRVDEFGKGVDSQESSDYGDEPTEDDFHTVATLPQSQGGKRKLQYSAAQMHRDLGVPSSVTAGRTSSPARTFVTQPTQTLANGTIPTQTLEYGTQATLPLAKQTPPPVSSDVQVAASSPAKAPSSSPRPSQPPQPQPQPIKRAFAPPNGFLRNAMAPAGTMYRGPPNVQRPKEPQQPAVNLDSDDDPPVDHSSDEETQGRSNLKPTAFRKGGRGLDSTPNRDEANGNRPVVQESPTAAQPSNWFGNLLRGYEHKPNAQNPADDSVSAYGSSSRAPRPPKQGAPKAQPKPNMVRYNNISDIGDYVLERKVREIQRVYPHESIDRCMTALAKHKNNADDAMGWLAEDEEQDAPGDDDDSPDELAPTPAAKRGVAIPKYSSSSQNVAPLSTKPSAKQQVDARSQTIAQRYQSTQQPARKQSQPGPAPATSDDDAPKAGRRLQRGPRRRSATPPSSPPPLQRPAESKPRKQVIAISDDEDEASDSGVGQTSDPPEVEGSSHDEKLLKFFNECSVQDLADISAQPEDIAQMVVDQRPFESLDVIRTISSAAQTTKSGKASRARPIGDKIVDVCSEMWEGYDAVDELVGECERLAKPIQEALKNWGVGPSKGDGELQLMNLDEAHDSGIGTPSSTASDDVARQVRPEKATSKGRRFLSQPASMSSDVQLKNYQLVGLNWLNLLWSQQLSCILADDMGLGKTCQVISFLAYLQQQHVDGVHLVIVPGSTLENWLREFRHFAPNLKVLPYYGSQKERRELQDTIETEFGTIDVVVTTYDMAVGEDDNKFLRKHVQPSVCVYDEAHALRNTNSKRYRQLTRIPADFRILLTGTPLQNNLQELVAILAFIMPDMFHDKHEQLQYVFQHKATTKSADHTALLSAQRIARARTMMTPFILRRKKQQVLDLPAKHSRVEYCDMTADQADYYAEVVEEAQAFFANKGAGKNAASKKASSNVLMALRKAAIHPLLARRHFNEKRIDKMVEALEKEEFQGNRRDQIKGYLEGTWNQKMDGGSTDYSLHKFCLDPVRSSYMKKFALKAKNSPWMDSGKVKKFCELVKGFAKSGDRLLVFSQFTSMMDILEAVLETLSIKFMRLDGSTKMDSRQDMIDTFTSDKSITVFMLSTKAGGAGINLAAANKVIIFDAGFNPQDDIQAENRAHRVGQTRDVEVVRLVTRGTIEEQIHALGESKLALDERVAGEEASAADEKVAEKSGEEAVQRMFLDNLPLKKERDGDGSGEQTDLRDAFKDGMQNSGVKIASKQAQY